MNSAKKLLFSSPEDVKNAAQVDYTLGIVGVGPAGLAATEALLSHYANSACTTTFKLLLFNSGSRFGCGPNYDYNQVHTNWLNVPDRQMKIAERHGLQFGDTQLPAFNSYHTWRAEKFKNDEQHLSTDEFVPRALIGEYLKARFDSLASALQTSGLVHLINAEVVNLSIDNEYRWTIETAVGSFAADSVLITAGHQPIEQDEQLTRWKQHCAANDNTESALFDTPYPVTPYQGTPATASGKSVALRGMGLSMIDVVRALTIGHGGRFETVNPVTLAQKYFASGNEPDSLKPFSLDGLPVAPKPISHKIDAQFDPTNEAKAQFESELADTIKSASGRQPAKNLEAIVAAIATLAASVYPSFYADGALSEQEVSKLLSAWVIDQQDSHHLFVCSETAPLEAMQKYNAIAAGLEKPSLDYLMGQVWRKAHPVLYKQLSHSALGAESIALITAKDEQMKRYTFGPPVESVQQLVALVSTKLLDLNYANDPTINQHKDGWTFSTDVTTCEIDTIVDTVLAEPKLSAVSSELIKQLHNKGVLNNFHSELGATTNESAQVISSADHDPCPRLSLLGRLAKGSLFGTDAILECFGERPHQWAKAELAFIQKSM